MTTRVILFLISKMCGKCKVLNKEGRFKIFSWLIDAFSIILILVLITVCRQVIWDKVKVWFLNVNPWINEIFHYHSFQLLKCIYDKQFWQHFWYRVHRATNPPSIKVWLEWLKRTNESSVKVQLTNTITTRLRPIQAFTS